MLSKTGVAARARKVIVSFAALIMAVACGGQPLQPRDESAANLMPKLDAYTVLNTSDVQDAITKVLGGTALASGNLPLAGAVAVIGEFVKCYQQKGALEGRVYISKEDATNSGIVLIVNQKVVANPATFLDCALGRTSGPSLQAAQLQPCANAYALNKDNNTFYIIYAATNLPVCQDFCRSLEGCTQ